MGYERCFCIVHDFHDSLYGSKPHIMACYKDRQLAEYDLRGGLGYLASVDRDNGRAGESWWIEERYVCDPRYDRWYAAEGDKLIAAVKAGARIDESGKPIPAKRKGSPFGAGQCVRVDPYVPPNPCVVLSERGDETLQRARDLFDDIVMQADDGHPARQASLFLAQAFEEYRKAFIHEPPEK
jgi:hypothetical protein